MSGARARSYPCTDEECGDWLREKAMGDPKLPRGLKDDRRVSGGVVQLSISLGPLLSDSAAMRAADSRISSSSTWLGFGGSGFSAGFLAVRDSTCSRMGNFGRGLIDDKAIDFFFRATDASGFDTFAGFAPLSMGASGP